MCNNHQTVVETKMPVRKRRVASMSSPNPPPQSPAVSASPSSPPMSRVALLALTYVLYIIVDLAQTVSMPAIKRDLGFSTSDATSAAAAATAGTGIAKLLYAGWPADLKGGRWTIAVFSALTAGVVLCNTLVTSVTAVALLAFATETVAPPIYPGHVQIVRGWWSHPARGFVVLGFASRGGDMLARLFLGGMLEVTHWRSVIVVGAGVGFANAVVAATLHRDSPPGRPLPKATLRCSTIRDVVRRCATSWRFGLAASAFSCVTIVKRSLEFLLPLYFSDLTSLSDGAAAQMSVVWSVSLLLSVVVGGHVFTRLQGPSAKPRLVASLLVVSAIACSLLAVSSKPTSSVTGVVLKASLVFVAGTGIGVAYYVPPGTFAVLFGGSNSGVVSTYLDGIAFVVSAAFIGGLRPALNRWGWASVWVALACITLVAVGLQQAFISTLAGMEAQGGGQRGGDDTEVQLLKRSSDEVEEEEEEEEEVDMKDHYE